MNDWNDPWAPQDSLQDNPDATQVQRQPLFNPDVALDPSQVEDRRGWPVSTYTGPKPESADDDWSNMPPGPIPYNPGGSGDDEPAPDAQWQTFAQTAPRQPGEPESETDTLPPEPNPDQDYHDQLMQEIIAGHLNATPQDDGTWNFSLPDPSVAPPAPVKTDSNWGPGALRTTPSDSDAYMAKPMSDFNQDVLPQPAPIDLSMTEADPRVNTDDGLTALFQARTYLTGESDPGIQQTILHAFDGLNPDDRAQLLYLYKQAKADPSQDVMSPNGQSESGLGMSREDAWKHMLDQSKEFLQGGESHAGLWGQLEKYNDIGLDPLTAAAKQALGEDRYNNLPGWAKTGLQWAPIILMPEEGAITTGLEKIPLAGKLAAGAIRGTGLKEGALLTAGAMGGEALAESADLPNLPTQILGATLTTAAGARFTSLARILHEGELTPRYEPTSIKGELPALPQGNIIEGEFRVTSSVRDELESVGLKPEDIHQLTEAHNSVVSAAPDDIVTLYHGTTEEGAQSIRNNGFAENTFLSPSREDAETYARVSARMNGGVPQVVEVQAPKGALKPTGEDSLATSRGAVLLASPELARLKAMANGVEDPHVVAVQAKRSDVTSSVDGFSAKNSVPVLNEVRSGIVQNAKQVVKDFVANEVTRITSPNARADGALADFHANQETTSVTPKNLFEAVTPTGGESFLGARKNGTMIPFGESKAGFEQDVKVTWPDGTTHYDTVKGTNQANALARARLNWDGAKVEPAGTSTNGAASITYTNPGLDMNKLSKVSALPSGNGWVGPDGEVYTPKNRESTHAQTTINGSGDKVKEVIQAGWARVSRDHGALNVEAKTLGQASKAIEKLAKPGDHIYVDVEKPGAAKLKGDPQTHWSGTAAEWRSGNPTFRMGSISFTGEQKPSFLIEGSSEPITEAAANQMLGSAESVMVPDVIRNRPEAIPHQSTVDMTREYGVMPERLASMPPQDIRQVYEGAVTAFDEAQQALGGIEAQHATGQAPEEMMLSAREDMAVKLQTMRDWGQALSVRTGGKEGLPAKIIRAIDQFVASEEGAVKIPRLFNGPNGPQYIVHDQPVTAMVKLLNPPPIIPHVSPTERIMSIFRESSVDPLGWAVTKARTQMQQTRDSLTAVNTQKFKYLGQKFPMMSKKEELSYLEQQQKQMTWVNGRSRSTIDLQPGQSLEDLVTGQRLRDVVGHPTMQDLAAHLPTFDVYLNDEQRMALQGMRDAIRPYYEAMIQMGKDIPTRGDIEQGPLLNGVGSGGGFYLPRGMADVSGVVDEPAGVKLRGSRAVKKGLQQPAVFDSMVDGIHAGWQYHPFPEVMQRYFKDAADILIDGHLANVLKNATDISGAPITLTQNARLMKANPQLAAQVDRIRKNLLTLNNSIQSMNDFARATFEKELYTPAPDLSALKDAVEAMGTKAGDLRIRQPLGPAPDVRGNFKILRREVMQEVFINRGTYKGMSFAEASKEELKKAVDNIRIKRGRFRGLDEGQAKQLLAQTKTQLDAIMPQWRVAQEQAAKAGHGMNWIEPASGIGKNLRGDSFPDALALTVNKELQQQGLLVGKLSGIVNPVVGLNSILTASRAGLDMSFIFLQGSLGLFHEPVQFAKAFGYAARALRDPLVLGRYMEDFDRNAVAKGLPTANDWVAHNAHVGGLSEYASEGLEKTPLLGRMFAAGERAFGNFGDILRLEGNQSQYRIKGLANMTGQARSQAMRELANFHNAMTGWAPERFAGDIGSFFMFAPRFFQAQLDLTRMALDPMHPLTNMSADQARRSMFKMMAMGATVTFLANEALGNNNDATFDYLHPFKNGKVNPNFMRIRTMGQDISIFGPYDSLFKVFVSASNGDLGYIAQTKLNPIWSGVVDQFVGHDFVGNQVPHLLNLTKDAAALAKSTLTGDEFKSTGNWSAFPGWIVRSIGPLAYSDDIVKLVSGTGGSLFGLGAGATGLKATPLSNSELHQELERSGMALSIKNETDMPDSVKQVMNAGDPSILGSAERKLVDRTTEKASPGSADAYKDGRRAGESVYQQIEDQADAVRAQYKGQGGVYDQLLKQLYAGEDPKAIWTAFDNEKTKLNAQLQLVYNGAGQNPDQWSPTTKAYQEAIANLPQNDMRKLENDYAAIITKDMTGPSQYDWDKIAADQQQFIADMPQGMQERFNYTLALKQRFNTEDGHPLELMKKQAQTELLPYYDIQKEIANKTMTQHDADLWLNQNVDADVSHWLTEKQAEPTLHSVAAAEQAIEKIPARKIRFAGSQQALTSDNLPIVQQYEQQITQLLTLPGTDVNPHTNKPYSPTLQLRQQDPLYDALYAWLFDQPTKDAAGKTAVVVYHKAYVDEFLRRVGGRDDGVATRMGR